MPASPNLRALRRNSQLGFMRCLRYMRLRLRVAFAADATRAACALSATRAAGEARARGAGNSTDETHEQDPQAFTRGASAGWRDRPRPARTPSRMAARRVQRAICSGLRRDARYLARRTMPPAAAHARRTPASKRIWGTQGGHVRRENSFGAETIRRIQGQVTSRKRAASGELVSCLPQN